MPGNPKREPGEEKSTQASLARQEGRVAVAKGPQTFPSALFRYQSFSGQHCRGAAWEQAGTQCSRSHRHGWRAFRVARHGSEGLGCYSAHLALGLGGGFACTPTNLLAARGGRG